MKYIIYLLILSVTSVFANEQTYIIKLKYNDNQLIESIQSNDAIQFKKALDFNETSPKYPKNLSSSARSFAAELDKYYIVKYTDLNVVINLLGEDIIENIEPNRSYSIENTYNDEFFDEQWALTQLEAERAWQIATGEGVIIGVIDTGIDFQHPDLQDNLWINAAEDINNTGKFEPWSHLEERDGITGDLDGIDNDGNGFADDVIGYDFVDQTLVNFGDYNDPDPIPEDQGEHGTLVSGLIAAKANNEIGIAGLAYSSKILTAKAFDATGNAETDDVAAAIIYAVNNGAKVLNFSFGESHQSSIMHDAIKYAYQLGVVMFSSSGNNNWFLAHYPSDYPEVICVGASNSEGQRSALSNYGPMLDILAPGQAIITTDVNSAYKTTDGTSLASPYAAATAALLLEVNPDLTPNEIRGILRASATDIGDGGWDAFNGSGLLNAYSALTTTGSTSIEFDFPEKRFTHNKNNLLLLKGDVLTPLFIDYQILYGEGELPGEMFPLTNLENTQLKNDTIARLNLSSLPDTTYTISLKVNLRNNTTIEERIVVDLIGNDSIIKVEKFEVIPVYFEDKRQLLVYARTNIDSRMSLVYGDAVGDVSEYQKLTQIDYSSKFHEILIPLFSENAKQIKIIANFYNNQDSTTREIVSDNPNSSINSRDYDLKDFSMDRTYLLNQSADLYNDGNKYYIANDLRDLGIGKAFTFTYNEGKIEAIDSLQNEFIPISIGDVNNDGIPDILSIANFRTAIYQSNNAGGNPFEKEIFKSNQEIIFWGEHIYDINGDGIDEVIAYDNNGFFVSKYEGNTLKEIARTELPEPFNRLSTVKGSVVGDFNGDGIQELVHTNSNGNLFIHSFENNQLVLKKIFDDRISGGNQFIAKGDFDGDGILEIAHLCYGGDVFYERSSNRSVWTFRVFDYNTSSGDYEIKYKDHFYGVRSGFVPRLGISFRNGITSGDIDGDSSDEIAISVFPNFYIFKYENDDYKPILHLSGALSNSALIDDIDGDGVTEIGVSGFNSTEFINFVDESITPQITNAFINEERLLEVEWHYDREINQDFQIYYLQNNQPVFLDEVSFQNEESNFFNAEIEFDQENGSYLIFVAAVYLDNGEQVNKISNLYEFNLSEQKAPFAATFDNAGLIRVLYDGNLKQGDNEISSVLIDEAGNSHTPEYVFSNGNNVLFLKFFDGFDDGDFSLNVGSVFDNFGNKTAAGEFNLTLVTEPIEPEIFIERLEVLSNSLLKVWFSDKLDTLAVQNPDNFIMRPRGSIVFSQLDLLDSSAVQLIIDPNIRASAIRGENFTLTAINLQSQDGVPITKGAGNTIGFVFSADDLAGAYIYPNPIRSSLDEDIVFAGLTAQATIRVYTLDGEEIKTLTETDGNGGVRWDGRDNWGNKLREGIYFYRITGENRSGEEARKRFFKFVVLP